MSKEAPPSRTAPQFVVRMPDEGFRNRIAESAKENNRSMNAEIVARLEASFGTPSEPYATQSQLERVLGKIAREQNEAMMAVSLVRDMLGSYVQVLFKRLSAADQAKGEYALMNQLATAAIQADGDSLAKAAAGKMREDPGFKEMDEAEADDFFAMLGMVNQKASEHRRKMIDAAPSTDAVPPSSSEHVMPRAVFGAEPARKRKPKP